MKCTGTVASYTNSDHSYHIFFMCISVVAVVIITTIMLDGFYFIRVYVNVRTYYNYWYLPSSHLCRNYAFILYVSPDSYRRTAFINNYPKHLIRICIAELIVSWWVRNFSPFEKSEVHCRFDRIP
jgi:hypothetical protein